MHFFVLIPSFLSLLICLHDVIMLDKVICTFAMKLIMLTLGTREGKSTIVLHKEKKIQEEELAAICNNSYKMKLHLHFTEQQ